MLKDEIKKKAKKDSIERKKEKIGRQSLKTKEQYDIVIKPNPVNNLETFRLDFLPNIGLKLILKRVVRT